MEEFKIFDTTAHKDLNEALKEGNQIFKENYIDNNITLEDMIISFSPSNIDGQGFYSKFKHLASMGHDETGRKYDSYPCQNDKNTCKNDCLENFKEDFKEGKISRMYCPFRSSRIFWISKVIELYSKNDPRVRYIEKSETKNGRFEYSIKLWFQEGKTDYLIILRKTNTKYLYITSYPVVMKSLRDALKKEYKNTKNKKSRCSW